MATTGKKPPNSKNGTKNNAKGKTRNAAKSSSAKKAAGNQKSRPKSESRAGHSVQQQARSPRQATASQYATRGGVPSVNAFDNLPRRAAPPGFGQDTEPAPPAASRQNNRGKNKPRASQNSRAASGNQAGHTASPRKRSARPLPPARRRRNRRIAAVLGIILLIGAGVWFSTSVLFKIQDYKVQGDTQYTQDEIVAAFGHEVGENMFGFSAGSAAARIERMLPYIEKVAIRRSLPGTIVFKVTPAQEYYCVALDGRFAVLSAGRKVLRMADEEPGGLTRINGLVGVLAEPGLALRLNETRTYTASSSPSQSEQPATSEDGSTPDESGTDVGAVSGSNPQSVSAATASSQPEINIPLERMESFDVLMAELQKAKFDDITWIDVTDPLNLRFCWQNRVIVVLGNKAALDEKMVMVNNLMVDPATRKIEEMERGTLNVSAYPLNQDRAFFTPE